ncbi:TPA: IS1 family transposase, partial [Escherichia coli]
MGVDHYCTVRDTKSRQRWLFYAYDSLRKTVVAHVFG